MTHFPMIRSLNDVLPAIEGFEEFIVARKPQYTIVNYQVQNPRLFLDPNEPDISEQERLFRMIRRECRGLMFDLRGDLISRPLHKFRNLGESEDYQTERFDLDKTHWLLEKLDGSFVRPVSIQLDASTDTCTYVLATKMGHDTDVARAATRFWLDGMESRKRDAYLALIDYCDQNYMTPVFEYVSDDPQHQIVVKYPEKKLVLLAIRYNFSGDYLSYRALHRLNELHFGSEIDIVRAIEGSSLNLNQIQTEVREFKDAEGIVLTFESGERVKIKADDYVRKHKARDKVQFEKDILEMILTYTLDDVKPLLPPDQLALIRKYESDVLFGISTVANEIRTAVQDLNTVLDVHDWTGRESARKREFAMLVNNCPSLYRGPMFRVNSGDDAFQAVCQLILKNVGSITKVNSVRELFGNATLQTSICLRGD